MAAVGRGAPGRPAVATAAAATSSAVKPIAAALPANTTREHTHALHFTAILCCCHVQLSVHVY